MKNLPAYEDLLDKKQKIIDYINKKQKGKALFIFDHGLGDLIEFLSLYETFKNKFPKWEFKIGFHPTLNFDNIHPDMYSIKEINNNYAIPINRSIVQTSSVLVRYDVSTLCDEFDYIFAIQFYDFNHPTGAPIKVPNPKCKNDMCKVLEFGLPENTVINKYKVSKPVDIIKNKVVFHFNGNTDKAMKTPDIKIQEILWNELLELGLDPYDVHINSKCTISNSIQPLPSFIPEEKSIRNNVNANYSDLLSIINSSEYIVGICSGPMHLFCNLHGVDNAIGFQGHIKLSNYITTFKEENIVSFLNGYEEKRLSEIIKNIRNN